MALFHLNILLIVGFSISYCFPYMLAQSCYRPETSVKMAQMLLKFVFLEWGIVVELYDFQHELLS